MALCPVWTEKVIKQKQTIFDPVTKAATGTQVVPKKKVVLCGRKPEVYVRVFYKELDIYRKREGKYHDLFGLCCEHGPRLGSNVAAWEKSTHQYRGGPVSGLRGLVERVEMVPVDDADVRAMVGQDKALRIMAAVKADFKRKMGQRNVESLTVDHWRQVFEECIEEFVAEEVMES